MAALGWLLNLGFAGGTAGADPPTAQPGFVDIDDAAIDNIILVGQTANSLKPVKSKNSVLTE